MRNIHLLNIKWLGLSGDLTTNIPNATFYIIRMKYLQLELANWLCVIFIAESILEEYLKVIASFSVTSISLQN